MKKSTVALALLISFTMSLMSQTQRFDHEERWVDSVFSTLTQEERIGQLMIVRVPTGNNSKKKRQLMSNIEDYGAGGVCFFAGESYEQLRKTKELQMSAKVPLFVSIDGEWGLGMRLTDGYSFPRQMMWGALAEDTLVYLIAKEIALQCKKMGIHINFSPCIDVNSNPNNPVIGARSFGENANNVARKGLMYAKALEDNGVMAVVKHFPGHGDTETDSHHDLPVLTHSKEYLTKVSLLPFKHLIESKTGNVMIGHLLVKALDSLHASSLSYSVITQLLKKEMGFNRLVFSDGMDMKAITKHYTEGKAELMALKAGIDVILLPNDMPEAVEAIADACKEDSLLRRMVDMKCKKVLRAKYKYVLPNMDMSKYSVPTDKDDRRCRELERELAEKTLTTLKNKDFVLPIKESDKECMLSIVIACEEPTAYISTIDEHVRDCKHVIYNPKKSTSNDLTELLLDAENYELLVVSIFGYINPTSKKDYGVNDKVLRLMDSLEVLGKKTVVAAFMSPYALNILTHTDNAHAVVMAYQNTDATQKACANALFGSTAMEGVLPVSVSNFAEGLGKKIKENTIDPNIYEKVGMDKKYFALIDSIAQEGVDVLAYPGCRILVAKDGYTVYNKAFGYQTYDTMASRVELSTIYDIASVTKIVATTLAVMKLVDDGLVSIDDPLVDYLPYLKRTNKKNITIKQALSHYAQLQAFVPYWKDAVKSDAVLRITDNSENVDTTEYSIVSPNFYVEKDYRERILKKIADTKLLKEKKYVYSDFGFIFLGDLVERVSGQPLDEYVEQNFYIPMGLKHIAFKPLEKGFTTDEIAPTENDKHFRHTLVQGYVHDENSALLGGVAGHAGLFATANDLAAVLQMLIDGGTYKGTEYLSKEVIKLFNTRHYAKDGNRRALGFDKPFINDASTHVSPRASQSSFGHTGFTGTMVWADPDHGLVYIFLSNRVHPTPANSKLSKMNIRTNIQDLIYKSIKTK